MSKDISTKKSRIPKGKKFFWMFFILGIATLLLGVALLPVWQDTDLPWKDLGNKLFSLIFAAIILVYILGFLIKQVIREKKVAVKILTVFEAGFFFAVALGSIMQYLSLVKIGGPCTIVGAAVWSRGFVYIVKAYLCKHDETDKYPLWMLIVSVGLVTLGSIMMTEEIFTLDIVVWFASCVLILTSIIFIIFGFISKPKLSKEEKAKKKADALLKKEQKALQKQEKELGKQEKALEKQEKATLKAQEKADKISEKIVEKEAQVNALPPKEDNL